MSESQINDTDLEKQINEARARRAKLEADKVSRDEKNNLREVLEKELRAIRDEEALAEAEKEHGQVVEYGSSSSADGRKIAAVRTDLGIVIVKRPHHLIFKRFQDSGEANHTEFMRLCLPSLVHPDKATFERYIEEQAAILGRVASAVALLAGVRAKELAGKS